MNERQALEELLLGAEAMVAKIKARLEELSPAQGGTAETAAGTVGSAIDLVQSQKTSDNTGNY